MMTIYSEKSEEIVSKAQQLETRNKNYNEKNQLEIKRLIDKDNTSVNFTDNFKI